MEQKYIFTSQETIIVISYQYSTERELNVPMRTNVVSADMHLDDTVGSLVIPSCNTQQLSGSGYMVHHSLISTMATMAKLKHLNNLLVSMRTRCDAH